MSVLVSSALPASSRTCSAPPWSPLLRVTRPMLSLPWAHSGLRLPGSHCPYCRLPLSAPLSRTLSALWPLPGVCLGSHQLMCDKRRLSGVTDSLPSLPECICNLGGTYREALLQSTTLWLLLGENAIEVGRVLDARSHLCIQVLVISSGWGLHQAVSSLDLAPSVPRASGHALLHCDIAMPLGSTL